MAFDNLTNRLQGIFKKISGKSRLTAANMDEMLYEVRKALLEADVNFKVVKDFIYKVREQAIGDKVLNSLNPSQMVVKIVDEELKKLLGSATSELRFKPRGMTTILLCGLQGSGKTTQAAKLAKLIIRKYKKTPFLIGADIYRPAAKDQLRILADSIKAGFFSSDSQDAALIVKEGLKQAHEAQADVVIIDTAGRLHIDDQMMNELCAIEKLASPDEVLLVVDAMAGQDVANVAATFHQRMKLTGIILTKLDSDTRGGAALSVVAITGLPIKFAGVGEKIDDLDIFHPDRVAERILGMGDILSLIEKAEEELDEKQMRKAANRMMSGKFNLDDMLEQMDQMKKLGSLGGIMKMIPGLPKIPPEKIKLAEEQSRKYKIIIQSMTIEERRNPDLIKSGRKMRIAKGCGRSVTEVNTLLENFEKSKEQMSQMSKMMKGMNL